jgi:hypothetical protein
LDRVVPITERELLAQYGRTATWSSASLFVGAGLSRTAGYPGWDALLSDARAAATIPDGVEDLPLVAQYYVQSVAGGRADLESRLLAELSKVAPTPADGHKALARLPVETTWTTNYDPLLEKARGYSKVILREDDFAVHDGPAFPRLIKLHGSLTEDGQAWAEDPVITRGDYERYEELHPRMWASLRAAYLTNSFLFLGFSFTDPNLEIMLRLSRSLRDQKPPRHFTVLSRPPGGDELRMHELLCTDLEKTGIAVCEITDFAELPPLLERLIRRTRPQRLFVSGSDDKGTLDIKPFARRLGSRLTDLRIELASLGGEAGMQASFGAGRAAIAVGKYDPYKIQLHFRRSPDPAPPLPERIGTAIYSEHGKEDLRLEVLRECRAAVVVGGGATTHEEVDVATALRLPIVPVACTGGSAQATWNRLTPDGAGLPDTAEVKRDWQNLNEADIDIAAAAASRLIATGMYLAEDEP